jgi:UDP-2,4-diacetamido-2,4,6-trideoxy-beta-L-altropyranose hydrolase
MKPAVFLRCDGGTDIGMGHVVRCIALAHMLRNHFDITFILQETDETSYNWLVKNGFSYTTISRSSDEESAATRLMQVLSNLPAEGSIIVLDGYHFRTHHQHLLKEKGYRVVAIDDLHAWHHEADAVLNHAPGITGSLYQASPSTRFLLGADYALLRPSLLEATKHLRTIQPPKQFLISMGAADVHNFTQFFTEIIQDEFPEAVLHLLVSSLNPNLSKLQALSDSATNQVIIHLNLSTEELTDRLLHTDVVICPASTISMEACAAGCTLFSGYTAANQLGILSGLTKAGACFSFDSFENLTETQVRSQLGSWLSHDDNRATQLQNQRKLIDGKSGLRLTLAFLEIEKNAMVRKAVSTDSMLYFTWANDAEVRANSYQSAPIEWHDHTRWFEEAVHSAGNAMYLYSIGAVAAAQLRLKLHEHHAVINYSVSHDFRGRGIGKWMLLHIVVLTQVSHAKVKFLEGWVKKNNVASMKAFESAGYRVAEENADSVLFRIDL